MLRLRRYAAQFFSDFGFAASRRTVQSRGPEVVRQTRATIERTRLISQARMAIRLVEQRDPSVTLVDRWPQRAETRPTRLRGRRAADGLFPADRKLPASGQAR